MIVVIPVATTIIVIITMTVAIMAEFSAAII